jgi:hypothetical protein
MAGDVIGNFMYMSFAAGVYILYSVFCSVCCEFLCDFQGPTLPKVSPCPSLPSPLPHREKVNSLRPRWGGRGGELSFLPSPPSPFVENKLEININMKGASDMPPVHKNVIMYRSD